MPAPVTSARPTSAGRIRLGTSDFDPAMLRIHGDRNSLLAALTAHWAEQQLQIPQPLRPVLGPIRRRPSPSVSKASQP
jgi:hypothetical protein